MGLAVTGFFHSSGISLISWISSEKEDRSSGHDNPTLTTATANAPTTSFVVGLVSTSVQLLLLKEIMNIIRRLRTYCRYLSRFMAHRFGAGSGLAANSKLSDIRKINFYFSVSPLASTADDVVTCKAFPEARRNTLISWRYHIYIPGTDTILLCIGIYFHKTYSLSTVNFQIRSRKIILN